MAKQYDCFTAFLEIRILKGWYLKNEKASEAQILSGLYWEHIFYIGNVNWDVKTLAEIGGYVPLIIRSDFSLLLTKYFM